MTQLEAGIGHARDAQEEDKGLDILKARSTVISIKITSTADCSARFDYRTVNLNGVGQKEHCPDVACRVPPVPWSEVRHVVHQG